MRVPKSHSVAHTHGREVPQRSHRLRWRAASIIVLTLLSLVLPLQRVLAAVHRGSSVSALAASGPGFTGERELDPCLVNLRSRVYNRCQGRFLQPDGGAGSAAVPGTLNRYSFAAGGNPVAPDPSSQPIGNPIQASVQAMRSGGAGGAFVGGLCLINPVCWLSTKYIDNLPAQACETEDQRRARAMGNLITYAKTAAQAGLVSQPLPGIGRGNGSPAAPYVIPDWARSAAHAQRYPRPTELATQCRGTDITPAAP